MLEDLISSHAALDFNRRRPADHAGAPRSLRSILLITSVWKMSSGKPPAAAHRQARQPRVCPNHRKLLIKMTSLLSLPRVNASCLPSRDHSKSKISLESKCVTCFGGPPVRRCCQMLETPFRVNA